MQNLRWKKVGLIGIGAIAKKHAEAVAALGGEVVAACAGRPDSPNWPGFLEVAPTCRRLPDWRAVVDDPEVEAIVACAPWDRSPEMSEALIEATDKPLLLEKPVALSAAQALRLVERAGDRDHIIVGYNRRFYEPVAALREAIARQRPVGASVRIGETVIRQVERFGPEIAPHLLAFSSAHALDLAVHLLGPLSVRALAHHRTEHQPPSAEDGFLSVTAMLTNRDGVPVTVEVTAEDPGPNEVRFRFDGGLAYRLAPLESLQVLQGIRIEEPGPGRTVRRFEPIEIDRVEADGAIKPGVPGQMAAFLTGDRGPAAGLRDALRVMELLEAFKRPATVL